MTAAPSPSGWRKRCARPVRRRRRSRWTTHMRRSSAGSARPAMSPPSGRTPLRGRFSGAKPRSMTQPGFTGAALDRADHLRLDPGQLADLMANSEALLLRLDGVEPVLDPDWRLDWAPLNGESDLILLGLEDGRPLFAPLVRMAQTGQRAWAIFRVLSMMSQRDAAIWGAARSLNEWHNKHPRCSVCGRETAPFRAGWGRKY